MRVIDTPLSGLKLVQLELHGDARGFFVERFHAAKFAAAGLPTDFIQDNHSRSAPGIIRGLHAQYAPPQGKLVGCVRGAIWDVAVDIRAQSPTFGAHYAVTLSDTNGLLLWVPAGFAHGFCVAGDTPADVVYKVTAPYVPACEVGIHHADPALNIPWPVVGAQTSERDAALPRFAEYRLKPVF